MLRNSLGSTPSKARTWDFLNLSHPKAFLIYGPTKSPKRQSNRTHDIGEKYRAAWASSVGATVVVLDKFSTGWIQSSSGRLRSLGAVDLGFVGQYSLGLYSICLVEQQFGEQKPVGAVKKSVNIFSATTNQRKNQNVNTHCSSEKWFLNKRKQRNTMSTIDMMEKDLESDSNRFTQQKNTSVLSVLDKKHIHQAKRTQVSYSKNHIHQANNQKKLTKCLLSGTSTPLHWPTQRPLLILLLCRHAQEELQRR